jgi:hypothetical protein
MAKRAKKQPEAEKNPKKDLLARIRERVNLMIEADWENRRAAMEDLKFVNVPGEQWDERLKQKRKRRPCYEFNKLRITCKRIINDMRANRPAGKVRGVEDSDKKTAEIYEGLIRNIWNRSDGDTVIDYAAEYQVPAGMGSWRISSKYAYEDAFDQDLCVEPIHNPFALFWDPAAKDLMKRDAMDCALVDRIPKNVYETRWPNRKLIDWEPNEWDDEGEWEDEHTVRVVEYWYKELVDKELWLLQDGKVIAADSPEAQVPEIRAQVVRKRQSKCYKVKMAIASGEAILEESEWAGSELPFVTVYGEHMVIDGKLRWHGLVRWARDPQMAYNVSRTAMIETVAMTPQAKFWATPAQAKGHMDKWEQAIAENIPVMQYNPDPAAPGAPVPTPGAQVPAALVQLSMLDSEDIKAVTGIFDPSLGNNAPEKSGRAIIARQQQGEIATFNYQDNMAKGIRRTWEILIDLVPKVYDTERELRILGADGAEDYVMVNQVVMDPATGKATKVNDLAQGRYDVTVTIGPSFTTKRQEAAETYLQLAQASPAVMAVAGDLVFKAIDLPYSEEIADRLKAMLPPPIQQMLTQGKEIPPEAQAVMAQAAQAMQLVEQQNALVAQAAQELLQEKEGVEKGKAEIETALARLETKKAQFDAHVAQQIAKLTQMQSQLQVGDAQLQAKVTQAQMQSFEDANAGEREKLESQVAQALERINEMAQQFAVSAAQVLQQIQAQANQPKPRLKAMKARRVNGELIAEPVFEE